MADRGLIQVIGTQETISRFDRLETDIIVKGLKDATRAAGSVLVRASAKNAPRDQGDFRKTMGQSVKLNRGERSVEGQVGQSSRKRKKHRAVHLHLVENPTAPHKIRRRIGNRIQEIQHPGTRGNAFLKRTARSKMQKADQSFERSLLKTINRFAAREGPVVI